MKIARVFPRRTKATPDDSLAFTRGPILDDFSRGIDEVHVSVAFTYDLPKAEKLARLWSGIAPVKIGGPGTGMAGGDFTPGLYLKHGYIITSRGCPNRCWFCSVPKREGALRELPITPGWNLLDDNLLRCSDKHIREVLLMMSLQQERPRFTGGLEPAALKPWQAELLKSLSPQVLWFAYDTPSDYEPLVIAGRTLRDAGFTTAGHSLGCYVLIGWPDGDNHPPADTIERAERRLKQTVAAGFFPQAMLYRASGHTPTQEWRRFAREWANKIIVGTKMRANFQSKGPQ